MNAESRRGSRISLLYHSGPGGTKLVAELLGEILSPRNETCVTGVNDRRAVGQVMDSHFPVFCYPTYFLRPGPSIREFVAKLGPFSPRRRAYVVTTYELYAENSIRAFGLMLKARGIDAVGSKAVRSPGADLTCLFPNWICPWLYRFEKGFGQKLRLIAAEIEALAAGRRAGRSLPAAKWYTPLAQLLQVAFFNKFERWRERFRLLEDQCSLCGACVAVCDRRAWELSGKVLRHLSERCELCTRCIHRCPQRAIVLIEKRKDNPRLDPRLYASLKEAARAELRAGSQLR